MLMMQVHSKCVIGRGEGEGKMTGRKGLEDTALVSTTVQN